MRKTTLVSAASFSILMACGGHKNADLFLPAPGVLIDSGVDRGEGGAGVDGGVTGEGGLMLPVKTDGGSTADGGGGPECSFHDDIDHDGDGVSWNAGDCNDCSAPIHPGALDLSGNGLDDDCSGGIDDEQTTCDQGIALEANDPYDAARAIGLCRKVEFGATKPTWGVVSARYVKPDGTPETQPLSRGVLDTFGVNKPLEGASMLALSSGTARAPNHAGYKAPAGYDKAYSTAAPVGYPKESPACPGIVTGMPHDGAGLEVTLHVPTNVHSFSYKQNFFTYEFPSFICSVYNDFYLAMMTPVPAGLPDGNLAFDALGNPVSVNNSAFLQACAPQTSGTKVFACPLGIGPLSGTGYETHAATGWLTTTVPVTPGSTITLHFTVFDSGDGILDSTVVVDDFRWSTDFVSATSTSATP